MNHDRTAGISGRRRSGSGRSGDERGAVEDEDLAPGARLGEYVIEGTIAAGGCGTVYSAQHRLLGRQAAVKVLHRSLASSAEMVERFVREARVVNQIRSPHIIDIYDLGELPDGRPFMVMELLRGVSLRALLDKRGRLAPLAAARLFGPVCAALQSAHEAGVVHRDLKASNLMVESEDEPPQVKLLDFGIAKLLRQDSAPGLTAVGQRLGTPYAMSPEQIRAEPVDARADVYALGVLLYQCLTGAVPFHAAQPAELERLHLEEPPPRPSWLAPVPPALDQLVLQAMEKDPSRRPPSARAFYEQLQAAVQPVAAAPREAQEGRALAVYVEVHLAPGAAEDDAALEALGCLLDSAEQELTAAGLQLYLATGSALLGCAPLESDPEAALAQGERARAAAVLIETHGAASDKRLGLRVRVHEARADIEETAAGPMVAGGPVVQVGNWPRPEAG